MSILSTIRGWFTGSTQRQREASERELGYKTLNEAEEEAYGGLSYGKGISPTGTPTDWTADQKKPKY